MTDLKDPVGEMSADLLAHLVGEIVAPVEHGQDNAPDQEMWVEVLLDQADGLHQLAEPLHGVKLALEGDQNRIGGREGVDRQTGRGKEDNR